MKKLVMVEFYFDDHDELLKTYDEYYFIESLSDIKKLKEIKEQSQSNHWEKKLSSGSVLHFLGRERKFNIYTSYVEDDFDFDKNDIIKEDGDYKYKFRTSFSVPGICRENRMVSREDLFQELEYELDGNINKKVEKIQDIIKRLNLETKDNKGRIKTKEEEILQIQREINLSNKWVNKLKDDLKTKQQNKSKNKNIGR